MQEEFDRDRSEEFLQNEELAAEIAEKERVAKAKTKLRFAASRLGWATALLVAAWIMAFTFVSALAPFANFFGIDGSELYNKYIWIINEVTLGIAIAIVGVILCSVPRVRLHKNAISVGGFLKILAICFSAGYIGNIIGTALLTVWNLNTGNSVGDELVTLLADVNPIIMIISVVILGPMLEELFFRKLLIDRLRMFGETTSILLAAFLFALFHMSASQLIYAFTIGIVLGYFYCKTGNYWLTVLIHAIFNMVAGVIPMLFLPKLNAYETAVKEISASAPTGTSADVLSEMMMPLLEEYGPILGWYGLYALAVLALNITGLTLLFRNFKKFRDRRGEFSLPFKTSVSTAFQTSGIIVCTLFLGIMTVISLFE